MLTQEQTSGQWHELKQLLKDRWGQLTEHDLHAFDGNMEALVSEIQQKTGEARETINEVLQEILHQGIAQWERALEAAKECSTDVAEAAHQTYDRVADNIRTGIGEAENVVRQRPMGSVAVAFGAGILTGVIVGLITRRR